MCFSPIRNDPETKPHKQMFGTHPVPGQSRKFVYVYVFFLSLNLASPETKALSTEAQALFSPLFIREITPGLLQHVLTVLVFLSWVLLLPRLPPWSRSLRLIPWASVLLYGPLDIAWICCPQLPHHPCKNGTRSTCFYSTGGHTPSNVPHFDCLAGNPEPRFGNKKSQGCRNGRFGKQCFCPLLKTSGFDENRRNF